MDYLKYDNCHARRDAWILDRYAAMRDALAAAGRPIVYSLCQWGVMEAHLWGPQVRLNRAGEGLRPAQRAGHAAAAPPHRLTNAQRLGVSASCTQPMLNIAPSMHPSPSTDGTQLADNRGAALRGCCADAACCCAACSCCPPSH